MKMANNLNYVYFGYDKFSAAKNMAIDEILKNRCEKDNKIYIRFYDFERPCVILSYSDSKECLRKEAFENKEIEISRRQSGGKPIYIDSNILAYSIIGPLNKETKEFTSTVSVHNYFGIHIAEAIDKITEIGRERITIGDVYSIKIDGKPVAGHAQFPTLSHSFFYHGVLAVGKWDILKINSLLNLSKVDFEALKVSPCITDLLKREENINKDMNSIEKIKQDLAKMILELISGSKYQEINSKEKSIIVSNAESLATNKYSTKEWINESNKGIKLKTDSRFCLLYEG
jgi:lipoate-protein ligase A